VEAVLELSADQILDDQSTLGRIAEAIDVAGKVGRDYSWKQRVRLEQQERSPSVRTLLFIKCTAVTGSLLV